MKNVNKKINLSTAPNDAIVVKEKEDENGKVSEIIAKKTGLSPRTYERAKKIIEEASEEVKEKLRQGKTRSQKNMKTFKKIGRDKNYYLNLIIYNLVQIPYITIANYFMEIS